jgi:hypothetical protein
MNEGRCEILKDRVEEYDPDTMVDTLTPKPTLKAEPLVRAPPTIVLCHEEDAALRKWQLPRYCCASFILETKTKSETLIERPGPTYPPKYR